MADWQPVGAASRSDLFGNDGAAAQNSAPVAPEPNPSDGPLELEHVIGYSGKFNSTVLAHPTIQNLYLKSMGSVVVICDANDPHSQFFLRGHDMEISAMAISPSGNMIASGQLGTTHQKGYGANIVVWEWNTRQALFTLEGHTVRINKLSFSPDDRFLCGCGEDSLIYIWDMTSGEIIFGKRFASPVSLWQWCAVKEGPRRRSYEVLYSCSSSVNVVADLVFDPVRRQWALEGEAISMPSGGLIRTFNCNARSLPYTSNTHQNRHDPATYVFAGSCSGDMLIYRIDMKVYRASVPVCSGGLTSLVVVPDSSNTNTNANRDVIICGAGDGSLKKLVGNDMSWELVMEGGVDGGVVSLTTTATSSGSGEVGGGSSGVPPGHILAGTTNGSIYAIDPDTLQSRLLSSAHTSPISAVCFPPLNAIRDGTQALDQFATISSTGLVKVWTLDDYSVVSEAKEVLRGGGCGTDITWIPKKFPLEGERGATPGTTPGQGGTVATGWEDGFVRAYDTATGLKVWEIPQAHRGASRSIQAYMDRQQALAYLATGGDDGVLRIWALRSRELMIEFAEHQRGITSLLVDRTDPSIIHTTGADCQLITYDLRKEKRVRTHLVRSGPFTAVSQRVGGESEVVTSDTAGRLIFWDSVITEPVLALQDTGRVKIRSVSVSPSGKYLAIAGDDGLVKVYDVIATGIDEANANHNYGSNSNSSNNSSSNGGGMGGGDYKVGGGGAGATVDGNGRGSIIAYGSGHSQPVASIKWAPDEKQIISVGEDCCICIWNCYFE